MRVNEAAIAAYISRFCRHLSDNALRVTPERRAIAETLIRSHEPMTVAQIMAVLADTRVNVSKATIYNTVSQMLAADLVLPVQRGRSQAFMALVGANTVRMVCNNCGKETYAKPDVELSHTLIGRRFGSFQPTAFTLTLNGLCGQCARRKKDKKHR